MAWLPSRHPRHASLWLCAILILFLGLWLFGGGLWLAMLGGARYYLLAGAGMIAAALLVLAGRDSGIWTYLAVLFCTLVWAFTEVGMNVPALWPRLWLPLVLGVALLALRWWRGPEVAH